MLIYARCKLCFLTPLRLVTFRLIDLRRGSLDADNIARHPARLPRAAPIRSGCPRRFPPPGAWCRLWRTVRCGASLPGVTATPAGHAGAV